MTLAMKTYQYIPSHPVVAPKQHSGDAKFSLPVDRLLLVRVRSLAAAPRYRAVFVPYQRCTLPRHWSVLSSTTAPQLPASVACHHTQNVT